MDIKKLWSDYLYILSLEENIPSYDKYSWQAWQEPFKTWTHEIITEYALQGKTALYSDVIAGFKVRLFSQPDIETTLIQWKKDAVQQQLIDNTFQTVENDVEEWLCKLLTTLIYENKRYPLQDEPCIGICIYFIILGEWQLTKKTISPLLLEITKYIKATLQQKLQSLPQTIHTLLADKENEKRTYFGSYLSDDSDSDEEEQVAKDPVSLSYENYIASQLVAQVEDYQPVTSKGTLYENTPSFKSAEYRWKINRANFTVQQHQDLLTLNTLIKQGILLEEAIKRIQSQFFIAQYRGIAYGTRKWNKPARQNHRNKKTNNETSRPQFSASVYKAAGAYPFTVFFKQDAEVRAKENDSLNDIAAKLENNLVLARETNPVVWKQSEDKFFVFRSQAHAMQNLYTNGYSAFHHTIKSHNFNGILLNDENPFISTGNIPLHALKYAYGTKYYGNDKSNRLRPRWRKDGRAERPYSGKVYVSLHPIAQYDNNGPFDVPTLFKNGELSSNTLVNILYERECTFPAWIEGEYVIAQHIAKYPSFHGEYKEIYCYKYGLTKSLYDLFKNAIVNSKPHSKENKHVKQLLGDWLCCYHEVRLIEEARHIAEEKGGILIYHSQDGVFALEPDLTQTIGNSPSNLNKASREAIKALTDFRYHIGLLFKCKDRQEINYEEAEALIFQLIAAQGLEPNAEALLKNLFSTRKNNAKPRIKIRSLSSLFSSLPKPELVQGITPNGEAVAFEQHKIHGGLGGECGIIALPIANKQKLYEELISVLHDIKNPNRQKVLEWLGEDIMQLVSLIIPDIKLLPELQMKLINLAKIYLEQSTEINRFNLKRACQQAPVCLSYLQDDLMKRNWISVNVLKIYGLIKGINIRIWQKQQANQIDVLMESLNNPNLNYIHNILYVNGNHFDLLLEPEQGKINIQKDEISQITPLTQKLSIEDEGKPEEQEYESLGCWYYKKMS